MRNVAPLALVLMIAGCASNGPQPPKPPALAAEAKADTVGGEVDEAKPIAKSGAAEHDGFFGAATPSSHLLDSDAEAEVAVWIDVPKQAPRRRAPVHLALVIDSSGSMQGDKLAHAKAAAKRALDGLEDGDIISIATFDDEARELLRPMAISSTTRSLAEHVVKTLEVGGSTAMASGLTMAERHALTGPMPTAVRRVIMISDGQANIGPSSPEALGEIAARGVSHGVQVTSLGVGIDYDERTLNALSIKTSGRLYHVGDDEELASTMERELSLLKSTALQDAIVEIVPARGVSVVGATGCDAPTRSGRGLSVPLGALFAGQRRELLVRVRRDSPSASREQAVLENQPLVSVRLRYGDVRDHGIERVRESIVRVSTTSDPHAVDAHRNERAHAIASILRAAQLEVAAAHDVDDGRAEHADQNFQQAEEALRKTAEKSRDAATKARLNHAADRIKGSRGTARAVAGAGRATRRKKALEMNDAALDAMGF